VDGDGSVIASLGAPEAGASVLADGAALTDGAPEPPGRSDDRPAGAVVTSPQAMIEAELPADGASGKADSLATGEAPVAADAGGADAPAAARMAIECGDPVSSLMVTGTVDVEVPPTTSWSGNCAAADALGASTEADGASEAAPEGSALATGDDPADAAAEADAAGAEAAGDGAAVPGKDAQSPSKSTAGIGADGSPPTMRIRTVVWPVESERTAAPVMPLPVWSANWTKAWGRLDGKGMLGTAGTLGRAGDAPC
jgi:hypothetical protein